MLAPNTVKSYGDTPGLPHAMPEHGAVVRKLLVMRLVRQDHGASGFCVGYVSPRPHPAGPVCHKPHPAARPFGGACPPGPIPRGLCPTAPIRPRARPGQDHR